MGVKAELEEFEKALRAKARTWSDSAQELGVRPGLRCVSFSGDLLRATALSGTMKEWLTQLFEQLPADVAVMDLCGDSGFVRLKPIAGGYCDAFFFVVASKEWPALEEGSIIPDFHAVFKAQWTCKNGCGYEGNTIARTDCEVCARPRGL